MVCTIPAGAWTWLVRQREASVVITNDAGLDAGEGNPGSVIILQKRLGVGTATVASLVEPVCASSPAIVSVRSWSSVGWVVPRGAFIVSVIGYSYMVTLLPLWPTMPSYPSITLVVLAVSRVITKRGVDHLTTDEDEPAHAIKRSRVDSPTTSRSPLTVLVNSIVVNTILLEFGISFLAGL
ncbi:hypothetical protein BHE74_00028999 [Ensete ventricosum]|nr:hypothetical protein BHE74_00028999 [Ensete ventricosum]RZS24712.1 hypothetical protein BHM03_00057846 [Ensete ventricosum]